MFLLLLPPLFSFRTVNIWNSAIILTPRNNTFHLNMVVHLVRKLSAFCSTKLHCRLHNRPSMDCITILFNSVLWFNVNLIYPIRKHTHLKLYSNMYHISQATFTAHHSLLDLITVIILAAEYKLKVPHFEIVSILFSFPFSYKLPYFQRLFLSLLSLLASGCAFGNTLRRFSYKQHR